ncbi:MAG: Two-component response regulator [candidate division WWE3 bacterium GW2011_GWB2_43_22]|uniref:Two-component response regulator n=1 Tax=candidate division WWE3 bacterium GW2011_GWB2_43_22 TaxID=1619118 RepID=A0A0G1ERD3_UNCKA|nr:MAG: Two-component response regulator [candidate division WWE3 bacterium GW2011_GWB2_43_22]
MSSNAVINEFHAEFRVLLRRDLDTKTYDIVKFKGFNLNLRSRLLFFGEQGVHLRKKEYELMEYFAFNKGRVITREVLLEHVWELGLETSSNTLVVHIRNLRMRFREYTSEQVIETKRGRGYILLA